MLPNKHPDTGIAYGYIHADLLAPELVDELLYQRGTNLTYEAEKKEFMAAALHEHQDTRPFTDEFDEARAEFEFEVQYQGGEADVIEGEAEGVKYMTSWLGGALHFWIFESPVIGDYAACSPCVPGAADLGNPGSMRGYGVPQDWMRT